MAVEGCRSNTEIQRVAASDLSVEDFQETFFKPARPVIITGATDDWPCRGWTIKGLMERVGDNEVLIRGKTNQEDYRLGKACEYSQPKLFPASQSEYIKPLRRSPGPAWGGCIFFFKHLNFQIRFAATCSVTIVRISWRPTHVPRAATWLWPRFNRLFHSYWKTSLFPSTSHTMENFIWALTCGWPLKAIMSSATLIQTTIS